MSRSPRKFARLRKPQVRPKHSPTWATESKSDFHHPRLGDMCGEVGPGGRFWVSPPRRCPGSGLVLLVEGGLLGGFVLHGEGGIAPPGHFALVLVGADRAFVLVVQV